MTEGCNKRGTLSANVIAPAALSNLRINCFAVLDVCERGAAWVGSEPARLVREHISSRERLGFETTPEAGTIPIRMIIVTRDRRKTHCAGGFDELHHSGAVFYECLCVVRLRLCAANAAEILVGERSVVRPPSPDHGTVVRDPEVATADRGRASEYIFG